jgi:hypothetical protein
MYGRRSQSPPSNLSRASGSRIHGPDWAARQTPGHLAVRQRNNPRYALQNLKCCAVAIGAPTGGPGHLIEILRGFVTGFRCPFSWSSMFANSSPPASPSGLMGRVLSASYAVDGDPLRLGGRARADGAFPTANTWWP